MKIDIEERILNNLISFLSRVDLKGQEAIYWVEVYNILTDKEKKLDFQKHQLENLISFLKRTQLTGQEVKSFNEVGAKLKEVKEAFEQEEQAKEE